MTDESPTPTSTPWGAPQTVQEIAPGIVHFTTASHGGYWLSPGRVAEMPKPLRDFTPFAGPSWYEEDCDWSLVALAFPQHFPEGAVAAARATLERYQPELYRQLAGTGPGPAAGEPPIARPEDLDYELARRAHAHTSHDPERRARQAQQEYADDVNGLHAEMAKLATSEHQKALLAREIERYRQGYLKHYSDYLHGHSRCASSMITGPANFPARQQKKRGRAADRKRDEFLQWRERARAAIHRGLLGARSPEQKQDDAWQGLARELHSGLAEIEAIDERGSPLTRGSFVDSIAGKVERLAAAGEAPLVDQALALVRRYNESHGKPAISGRHRFWSFGELARLRAKAHDAARSTGPSTIVEAGGIRIVENRAAGRVQIVFDGKPDEGMRASLKGEGWRWSPGEEAWQRKLTNAAIHSAKRLTGLG